MIRILDAWITISKRKVIQLLCNPLSLFLNCKPLHPRLINLPIDDLDLVMVLEVLIADAR